MRTGPLPPTLKARVLASTSRKTPNASGIIPNMSIALPIEAELTEPACTSHYSGDQPPRSRSRKTTPDDASDTLAPPDLVDLVPSTTDDMSVDEAVLPTTTTPSCAKCHSVIQVKTIPALGSSALVETSPPALLFVDKDERPDWLLTSVNDHLQHTPYYLCLNKVVDLFMAQEERLGYPAKVSKFQLLCLHSLTLWNMIVHSSRSTICKPAY